jgi:hypothetical protein
MKKFGILLLVLIVFVSFSSCVKNNDVLYTGSVVELDAATFNANAVGVTFPILSRRPADGRASTPTLDPLLTRASGTIQLRVNLVGAQRTTDTEVSYQVIAGGTSAIEGIHYAPLPGKVVIPANSSFGFSPGAPL